MGGHTERRIVARIISLALIVGAVLYSPHWIIPALMCVVCIFAFVEFYEALFAGLLLDVLYGSSIAWTGGFSYTFTLSMLILLLIIGALKTRLRINAFQD